MAKNKPNVDSLIQTNPGVDPELLRAGLEAIRELREAGISDQSDYNILAPFARRTKPTDSGSSSVLRKSR